MYFLIILVSTNLYGYGHQVIKFDSIDQCQKAEKILKADMSIIKSCFGGGEVK